MTTSYSNPYSIAKACYDDEEEFFQIIDFCSKHGIVHSDNEFFICAYKTYSEYIKKNTYNKLDKADTWYVYIYAGNIVEGFNLVKPLKYLAYERCDDNIRLFNFQKFMGAIGAKKKKKNN